MQTSQSIRFVTSLLTHQHEGENTFGTLLAMQIFPIQDRNKIRAVSHVWDAASHANLPNPAGLLTSLPNVEHERENFFLLIARSKHRSVTRLERC